MEKRFTVLCDAGNLRQALDADERVMDVIRAIRPLSVETSRVESSLQLAAPLAGKLGCRLVVNALWDPDERDIEQCSSLVEGSSIDEYLSNHSADLFPQPPFPLSDFHSRIQHTLRSPLAGNRLILTTSSVVSAVVAEVEGNAPIGRDEFAVVGHCGTMKVLYRTESMLKVGEFDMGKCDEECDEMTTSLVGSAPSSESVSNSLSAKVNALLASAVSDPLAQFSQSTAPAATLRSVEEAEYLLKDLRERAAIVERLLETRVSEVLGVREAQERDIRTLMDDLRRLMQQQEMFQSRISTSLQSLSATASELSQAVAARSLESRRLQAAVNALAAVPQKPLPVAIYHNWMTDDGCYGVNVTLGKHYQMFVLAELSSSFGPVKREYKSLNAGNQDLRIVEPYELSGGDYTLTFKNKSDTKVISNVIQFKVQQFAKQEVVRSANFEECFLRMNLGNPDDVLASLSAPVQAIFRSLAVAWSNPNSDLVEDFVNTLIEVGESGQERVLAELERQGMQFDRSMLAA